jgi:hypothetical protein
VPWILNKKDSTQKLNGAMAQDRSTGVILSCFNGWHRAWHQRSAQSRSRKWIMCNIGQTLHHPFITKTPNPGPSCFLSLIPAFFLTECSPPCTLGPQGPHAQFNPARWAKGGRQGTRHWVGPWGSLTEGRLSPRLSRWFFHFSSDQKDVWSRFWAWSWGSLMGTFLPAP